MPDNQAVHFLSYQCFGAIKYARDGKASTPAPTQEHLANS